MLLALSAGWRFRDRLFSTNTASADEPKKSAAPANRSEASSVALLAEAHPATDEAFHKSVQPFFQKYCTDCHGNVEPEGGFSLAELKSPDQILKKRSHYDKVLKLLEISAMPPLDHDPLPTDMERKAVIEWLEAKLYYVNCELKQDVGRVTVRRLNRNEYNNTIRDLLGVDLDVASDFPSDDVGHGFDNIGDVLTVPPLLLEKYMDAAETVAAAVVVDPQSSKVARIYSGDDLRRLGSTGGSSGGFWVMASRGSVSRQVEFEHDGEYRIRIEAMADQAGDEAARVELKIDGRDVRSFETQGNRKPRHYEHTLEIKKGSHRIEAAFTNDYYNAQKKEDRNLYVRSIEVIGPKDLPLPEPHQRLVIATPGGNVSAREAARQVFAELLPRAFRRPVNEDEVNRILRLVDFALSNNESYERALQIGLQGVLVSPHFLFRIEIDDQPDNASAQRSLNSYEIASRLSYFLWSSMPDDELLRLAAEDQLQNRDVLNAQVDRMLADERSEAFVEHFAGQWLNLRNLEEITPDPDKFKGFDAELRDSMVEETLQLVRAIISEDRSILDFLDADFTFVNERLARHYGMKDVKGSEFRRVQLPAGQRAGVLTHASILMLTSNPSRTSPVKRGKWVLENILGTPPPPAPPNVPELEETAKGNPDASMSEQLKLHREDPGCASCHTTMDAIGFGFENFDAIGRWREKDGRFEIESGGTLPSGESFASAVELVGILKKRDAEFSKTLADRMLTYALGRGLEYYDRCTLDAVVDELQTNNYQFSVLVKGIVNSKPFLMRRGDSGVQP